MSAIKEYSSFVDGFYGTPKRVNTTAKTYPFAVNGDLTSAIYTSTYRVDPAAWTPATRGSVDPDNAGYYLIAETEPDDATSAPTALIRRTYANVPAVQTILRSLRVPKPSISGSFTSGFLALGSVVVHQPDATEAVYDAYVKQLVTSDSGQPSADGYPTGGTWGATFDGYTASGEAYNITAANLQTALNALTSVSNRGGCTVTGAYNGATGFTVTFAAYASIVLDVSGLNAGNGNLSLASSSTNSGYTQALSMKKAAWDISGDSTALTAGGSTVGAAYNAYNSSTLRTFQFYTAPVHNFDGGTYRIQIYGTYTAAIAYNASFADVEVALNALGIGTFTVTAHPLASTETSPNASGSQIRGTINWIRVPLSAGTFKIQTNGVYTANIAYNASAATIQAAMNATSTVAARGGVVVSGNLTDGITMTYTNPLISGDASSLTPSGSSITVVTTDGGLGRVQQITFSAGASAQRSLYCANHGLTAADDCYVKAGSNYYTFAAGGISVPDANTIIVLDASGDAYHSSDIITEIGKLTKSGYAPGTQLVRAKEITYFYLPGVTPGITTADDIPRPTFQGDDSTLLKQVLSNASSINYQVGELQNWRDSPILSLTVVQLNALDL